MNNEKCVAVIMQCITVRYIVLRCIDDDYFDNFKSCLFFFVWEVYVGRVGNFSKAKRLV